MGYLLQPGRATARLHSAIDAEHLHHAPMRDPPAEESLYDAAVAAHSGEFI